MSRIAPTTFTYRVHDGAQWSDIATVTIRVRDNLVESNDLPGPHAGLVSHVPNQLVYRDLTGAGRFGWIARSTRARTCATDRVATISTLTPYA